MQQIVCLISRADPSTTEYLTIEQGSGANLPEMLVSHTSERWTADGIDVVEPTREERKFQRVPGVMTEKMMCPVYVEIG